MSESGGEKPAAEPNGNGSTEAPPPAVKPSGIQPPKLGAVRSIPKPSGIKPPMTASGMSLSSSTTSLASTSSTAPATAISRIGRPCSGHIAPKAGPPPPDAKRLSPFPKGETFTT
ncbi:hypothetical protein pipiens_008901 [Culex pipiens pipiens]|uniref:Uncharacterized protein n=1 Tax=Culex pipiens pipiens TaxID=38569 RepID=A0ABD1DFR2_CULPP